MKLHLRRLLLLVAAICTTGCVEDHYEVELTPSDGQLHRKVTVYRQDSKTQEDGTTKTEYAEFPPEKLEPIARTYGQPLVTPEPNVHSFAGAFGDKMPDDIGGSGRYVRHASQMGSAWFYIERFRGDDDLAGQIDRATSAAGELTDLLIGWLKSELGPDASAGQFAELMEFLDKQFRRDMKNVVLHQWAARLQLTGGQEKPDDARFRLLMYFADRGYFALEQLPMLTRSMNDPSSDGPGELFLSYIRRLIAAKASITDDQAVAEAMAFLRTSEELQKSLEQYLRQTPQYAKLLAASTEEATAQDDSVEPPEPVSVVWKLAEDMLFHTPGGDDNLKVVMNLPADAVLTNAPRAGRDESKLVWTGSMNGRGEPAVGLPNLCYAAWVQPDVAFQTKQFGKVVLEGDDLMDYCYWRASLDPAEADQWDTFLKGLSPGGSLIERMEGFRFAGDPPLPAATTQPDADMPASWADHPRELILNALRQDEQAGQ